MECTKCIIVHLRFQSTHPVRGATAADLINDNPTQFQSTHPVRGATPAARIHSQSSGNFNPRTP